MRAPSGREHGRTGVAGARDECVVTERGRDGGPRHWSGFDSRLAAFQVWHPVVVFQLTNETANKRATPSSNPGVDLRITFMLMRTRVAMRPPRAPNPIGQQSGLAAPSLIGGSVNSVALNNYCIRCAYPSSRKQSSHRRRGRSQKTESHQIKSDQIKQTTGTHIHTSHTNTLMFWGD